MKKALWILGAVFVLLWLIQWSRSDYLEFNARRDDWHRRCDAYLGEHATLNDKGKATACQREAAELLAYARRKGWAK